MSSPLVVLAIEGYEGARAWWICLPNICFRVEIGILVEWVNVRGRTHIIQMRIMVREGKGARDEIDNIVIFHRCCHLRQGRRVSWGAFSSRSILGPWSWNQAPPRNVLYLICNKLLLGAKQRVLQQRCSRSILEGVKTLGLLGKELGRRNHHGRVGPRRDRLEVVELRLLR